MASLPDKGLKENSIIGRSWSSAKLFIVQNYTENANGYGPLTVQKCVTFLVSLRSGCAHVLSLWKIFLFYDVNVNQFL